MKLSGSVPTFLHGNLGIVCHEHLLYIVPFGNNRKEHWGMKDDKGRWMILARGWEEWADESNTDVSGGMAVKDGVKGGGTGGGGERIVCKNAPPALVEVPVSQPQAVNRGLVVIITVITGYRLTANQWQSHSNQVCVSFTMWTDFYTVSYSSEVW